MISLARRILRFFGANRTDTGVTFGAKRVEWGGQGINQKIEIVSGTEKSQVELSKEMVEQIFAFLEKEKELSKSGQFDCEAFAYLANGLKLEGKFMEDPAGFAKHFDSKWSASMVQEETIKPGDTVMLGNLKINPDNISQGFKPEHWAIYLGQGIYLSKFGSTGPLMASTLEEMSKGFEAKTFLKVSPKNKQ